MANHDVNVIVRAKDQASSTLASIRRSVLGFGAAFLSFRAIKQTVVSTVSAYMESEKAVNRLASALALINAEAQTKDLQAYAQWLQQITTLDDEAVTGIMALGASMGKMSGQTLKDATIAAIGLSKAFGIDLVAAMTLISKAALGNTATLGRYGIVLDKSLTSAEKLAAVLELGKSKFAMATAETGTFAGKLTQLKNAFGEAKEQIGLVISEIPGLANAITGLKDIFTNFKLAMDIAWTWTAMKMAEMYENFKHNIGAIGALLKWLSENWRNIFDTMWNFTKSTFSNMWENIKSFFQGVWSWLNGDGFDFKWTGLLEGFESTLTELPDIIKRNKGPIEQALSDELDILKKQFASNAKPNSPLGPGSAAGGAMASAVAPGRVAAVESRFLSGNNSAVNYARTSAEEAKAQTKLLQLIAKALERTPAISPYDVAVANFK